MSSTISWKLIAVGIGCILLPVLPTIAFAQTAGNMSYGVSSNAYVNPSNQLNLPFWLYANSNGKVLKPGNALINNYFADFRSAETDGKWQYGFALDLVSRLSDQNGNSTLYFPEFYGVLKYDFLKLRIGRFYDSIGINHQSLSSGSLMMGQNATPIPKIQLSTTGFVDIPFTRGFAQFKGMFSNGWLEEARHVSSPQFHQKYFYLKLNYKSLEGIGGIIHQVMWGGTDPRFGPLPSSFQDFLRVVTGQAALPESGAPRGDIINVIGNSIAGYEFRLNANVSSLQFFAHRLFFLEDKVSTRFRSPWDGMWSAGFKSQRDEAEWIKGFVWEHINTKQQDSKINEGEPLGSQTYYNHEIYQDGWTYENRILGNPLFIFGDNPNYVSLKAISNNIIVAHHFGISGHPTERLGYKTFATYSRNYGEFRDVISEDPSVPLSELRVDQYSFLFKLEYFISGSKNLKVSGSLALDSGGLYDERFGFQLGIQWRGLSKL